MPTIAALVASDFGDAAIVIATKDGALFIHLLLKTIALASAMRRIAQGPLERCDPSTLKAVGKVSFYQPDEVRSGAMTRPPENPALPKDECGRNGECPQVENDGSGRISKSGPKSSQCWQLRLDR